MFKPTADPLSGRSGLYSTENVGEPILTAVYKPDARRPPPTCRLTPTAFRIFLSPEKSVSRKLTILDHPMSGKVKGISIGGFSLICPHLDRSSICLSCSLCAAQAAFSAAVRGLRRQAAITSSTVVARSRATISWPCIPTLSIWTRKGRQVLHRLIDEACIEWKFREGQSNRRLSRKIR